VGPLRLLVGATAAARFLPFTVVVPKALPTTATLGRTADLIASGRVEPVIDRTFPLEEAAAAVRYMETEHARAKVVITVS
jgi:NADPH:quinone reductase-like Zn-dependent oxidoreductase